MAIKCRPDNSPFELSHSTAKRWNGEGFNAPILVTRVEIFKPGNDVLEVSYLPPVLFCREIYYPWLNEVFEYVRLPETNLAALATTLIVSEHFWEAFLEA